MRLLKPAFLLILVFLLGNAGFALAQGNDAPPQIENPVSSAIPYCSDSVAVAPYLTVKNITVNEASEGMKVSIANYKRGEDQLVWDEVNGFSYHWNNTYGHVEIKGVGSSEQYQEAIRKVYYKNIAELPTLNVRSFSISLTDADYLPATKHFYRYVASLDITWKEAKAAADTMKYYGLQGYLATITSSVENDFVWSKIDGVGWIGANDEVTEGRWMWVTGPEAGTHFWQGTFNSGYRVSNRYSNWSEQEPNNAHGDTNGGIGEDYAHINQNPDKTPKTWNDLRNSGDGQSSQYYRPQGFIVEFGGMENVDLKLSASASIEVAKIAFANQRNFEICEGESIRLNDIAADNSYSYSWSPNQDINSIKVSNPVVKPNQSIMYTAIGTLGFCIDTADFYVKVDPIPISLLPFDTTICKGSFVTLDAGEHAAYLWSNGETSRKITVADETQYWVKLSNDIPCEIIDTVDVKWSVRPVLDYSTVDTLVCGSKTQTLTLKFEGVTAKTNLISLDSEATVTDPSSLTPTITVSEYGKYRFQMEIIDAYNCEFLDTLKIEFHNQPQALIVMDEEECKGYSLDLSFGGVTEEDAMFYWFYNDTIHDSGTNLYELIIPLGYGELNRTVGLKVNEQGCIDSSSQNVTVTPNVEIVSNNNEGCTPLLVDFEAKATEDIDTYFWDFGDGNNSNNPVVSHEFSNLLTTDVSYDIALTVTSTEGCENTGVIDGLVVVHPIPTVDLSFDEADCNPMQMEIWYEGSASAADTFYWDLSTFESGEIVNNPGTTSGPLGIKRNSDPTVSIGISVVSEFGCMSESVMKDWKRKPVFELKVDTTEGCPPLNVLATVQVLDSVDNVGFVYDLGDGTTGAGNTAEHIYTTPNTNNPIQFIGTSAVTGCAETVVYDKMISVYPVPNASFTPNPDAVLVSDPEIVFENTTTGAEDYEWDFGDMSAISEDHSPTHRYSDMGFYNVILFAYNQLGCLDSTSNRVAVTFDKLFPPNAFSPNATLEEDREFRIYSEGVVDEGYQLLIFNRWGEQIFESNSQQVGWDGKMKNGNFAPLGVYTWVLQYNDFRGEKHMQQGTVTLVI